MSWSCLSQRKWQQNLVLAPADVRVNESECQQWRGSLGPVNAIPLYGMKKDSEKDFFKVTR